MNIAINATSFSNNPSGSKDRFVDIFSKVFTQDKKNRYFVLQAKNVSLKNFFLNINNVEFIETDIPHNNTIYRYFIGLISLKKILSSYNIDVFDTNYLPIVTSKKCRTIFTIYDLRYLSVYKSSNLLRGFLFKFFLSRAIKISDTVITISETMKKDLVNIYTNLKVVVLPCSTSIYKHIVSNNVEQKMKNKYILFVGHLEARKNIITLLKAYNSIIRNGYCGRLFIVSNGGSQEKDIVKYIKKNNLTEKVEILKNKSTVQLVQYYKNADLFVFPSLYEGFGIPILESMSLGCACAISDIPVFREVAADSAVFFNPTSANDMFKKINIVLNCKSIREKIIKNGNKRVLEYSSDKIASDYINIFTKY